MGFWSKVKKAVKKVVRVVRGVISQVVNIVFNVVQSIIGIPDWIGSLIGIRPKKKLRLKVDVLRDQNGSYLATQKELVPIIQKVIEIYKKRCNKKVIPVKENFIEFYDPIPPRDALFPSCDGGAWTNDLGLAGSFYSLVTAVSKGGLLGFGYASPVTAIVVQDIIDKKGCSLGPLTNYITIDLSGISTLDTLSHEIGHSCSLLHRKRKSNLMYRKSKDRGDDLSHWQSSIIRWSKHATYL